ncbi:MAG: hypothetical protein HW421_834 [Ignavibacteria bacterium]|nr:hypothetical protein [Ignavibacteria bacterium]
MKYRILLEKIDEQDFPKGWFYAYIPTLGLTTHGKGIQGAINAAKDLASLWIEEKIRDFGANSSGFEFWKNDKENLYQDYL